jgi:hypothetical protein
MNKQISKKMEAEQMSPSLHASPEGYTSDVETATQLANLFLAFEKAHGQFSPGGRNPNGKVAGDCVTIRKPALLVDWESHLAGKTGLGLIPLLDDNHCRWAAIDIDDYSVDPVRVEKLNNELALPLVVCRSKSGGVHCYLFLESPVPASEVVEALRNWAKALGYPGAEIFPKQTHRQSEDDVGNWINLPYFDAVNSLRYAIKDGVAISLSEFLELAMDRQANAEMLDRSLTSPNADLFEDGPPCLNKIAQSLGFDEGTRNDGMFNTAVYLQKRYGADWADHLEEYNDTLCTPPLNQHELDSVAKSASKKDYQYKPLFPR